MRRKDRHDLTAENIFTKISNGISDDEVMRLIATELRNTAENERNAAVAVLQHDAEIYEERATEAQTEGDEEEYDRLANMHNALKIAAGTIKDRGEPRSRRGGTRGGAARATTN